MKLIINGDDFGFSQGCNDAIIRCYEKGLMKSCSLMTNMDAAKQAATMAAKFPDLAVGVHLNLSTGKPLSNHPLLVDETGNFRKDLFHADFEQKQALIEEELELQIQRFVELFHRLPDHVDSHKGIENMDNGMQLMVGLASRIDRPLRLFTTDLEKQSEIVRENADLFPTDGMILIHHAPNASLHLEAVSSRFTPEQIGDPDLIVELVGHPGKADEVVRALSSLQEGREWDAELFLSDALQDWIEENGISLLSWQDMMKEPEDISSGTEAENEEMEKLEPQDLLQNLDVKNRKRPVLRKNKKNSGRKVRKLKKTQKKGLYHE